MKRYDYSSKRNFEKHRLQEWIREHKAGGFRCSHCKEFVVINDLMGTANRNHCNWCLWSKHVDESKGDRRATCHGGMRPVGLTFKHEGRGKTGEIMLIHLCLSCTKISINRIARDDPETQILAVYNNALSLNEEQRASLLANGIYLLTAHDRTEVMVQLFGK